MCSPCINLEEEVKNMDMRRFQAWIHVYLVQNEMKETAECFRNEADPSKLNVEKYWGNAKGKIDKLWNIYIYDDQQELNKLRKNIKNWREIDGDDCLFRRGLPFGRPPYMPHLNRHSHARKLYKVDTSLVQDMFQSDIIKVILSKHLRTRFFNAIFRYMEKNGMHESLSLLKKESRVSFSDPHTFDVMKDDLFEFWRFYRRNVEFIKPLFKGEEYVIS